MRYHFYTISLVLATLILVGCNTAPLSVSQFGSMSEVMRGGQTQPRISIANAINQPNAIAVGALENLDGEITIINGEVWVARFVDGNLITTGPKPVATDQATLLTLTHVSEWKSTSIDTTLSGAQLEAHIKQAADQFGVDTSQPFPFRIEGNITNINLHVINGYCPVANDPAVRNAEPYRWSRNEPTYGTVVGFFAPNKAGTMTHHNTSIHAHGIYHINNLTYTGHLDSFIVNIGSTLYIGS